jgi:hypothetical protein
MTPFGRLENKIDGHNCRGFLPMGREYNGHHAHGGAISDCYELENGAFIVSNDEYSSRVNFCPFCGAKAPLQGVVDKDG